MITVLVCGGRDYADHQAVKRALDTQEVPPCSE